MAKKKQPFTKGRYKFEFSAQQIEEIQSLPGDLFASFNGNVMSRPRWMAIAYMCLENLRQLQTAVLDQRKRMRKTTRSGWMNFASSLT
jgi:hypothetical protein